MNRANVVCPLPAAVEGKVTMAHGGGGRAMHALIRDVFHARFDDPALTEAHDGAVLPWETTTLACTTDSFVVKPLFFPGGDIGSLAVYGTANDLAMCGAKPLFLSCAFILEEGLELAALARIADSMRAAAQAAGVRLVTGDTKVVERGKGDGVYVNTTGIGRPLFPRPVRPQEVRPGDVVLLSGDVGRHAAAILSVRESLGFETALESDCAGLWPQVRALLDADVEVHCLRDLTRGGLATSLNEIAEAASLGLRVDEAAVPVRPEVASASEMLGLDPLYLACEGRFIAFVPERDAERALSALRGAGAVPVAIGSVGEAHRGEVRLKTALGVERLLDMLNGEQLPRIC